MRFLKKNKAAAVIMAAILSSCVISGCTVSPENTGAESSGGTVIPVMEMTREDKRTSSGSVNSIDLGQTGEELLITDAGDYRLSGELHGSIRIRAEEQIVHLFLNGVNVTSVTAPAINVESAGKVIITAESGTENTLTDGSKYISDDCDACIFSMSDITINGSGSLTVSGYYKDARRVVK